MATTASRSARESSLSQSLVSAQFSSVQFKMVSMQNIGRAHMHSTLSLRSSPNITFETFAWAQSPSLALTALKHGERGLHEECTEPKLNADSSWTWSAWTAWWVHWAQVECWQLLNMISVNCMRSALSPSWMLTAVNMISVNCMMSALSPSLMLTALEHDQRELHDEQIAPVMTLFCTCNWWQHWTNQLAWSEDRTVRLT